MASVAPCTVARTTRNASELAEATDGHAAHERKRRTLLVPVDFTESSVKALDYALSLAKRLNSSVTLLHIVDGMYGDGFVDSAAQLKARAKAIQDAKLKLTLLAASRMQHRVPMECVVRHGNVEYEIFRFAEIAPVHLIVLGRRARTALSRWVFGSVSKELLETSPCAVVVVPETPEKAVGDTSFIGTARGNNTEHPTKERRAR